MLQATQTPAVELPHPHQKTDAQADEKQRRIGEALKKFYKYFHDDLCFLFLSLARLLCSRINLQ